MNKILILGGYGNFGRRIAMALAKSGCSIIIAGRHYQKARQWAKQILSLHPTATVDVAKIDINSTLSEQLTTIRPRVVINTCGPFQQRDYTVAECCLTHSIHYIDLSDARDYVTCITKLDQRAKEVGVLIVSGASTVPGLSSAVLEEYKDQFSEIESLRYGISPGQRIDLGLATTQSLLSYIGKPLKPYAGHAKPHGWQQSYRQRFPDIGQRWMSTCDVPDLDLLPSRYGIKSIQFSAGMELKLVHGSLWLLGWLIRLGLPLNLTKFAPALLRLNRWLDPLGSSNGGMHINIKGKDHEGAAKTVDWFIIAKDGDGPQIPTIPAIVLAKKLAANELNLKGAIPCVGLVSLSDYLATLTEFNISVVHQH
ncbi:MAG: saccharopine dehydrogenase NADP-binding domain-containing protein [Gammaproteobacteria bacterium]|jgi:hypothetical protein